MTTYELKEFFEQLYDRAFYAKVYLQHIRMFETNFRKYPEEMDCSPKFYNVVYSALMKSLVIEVAKIFDNENSKRKSLCIKHLLSVCENEVGSGKLIPEIREFRYTEDGPLQMYPYRKVVEDPSEKLLKNCFGDFKIIESLAKDGNYYIWVGGTDYYRYLKEKYNSFSKQIDYLREQRNKIYAHTDLNVKKEIDNFIQHNPLELSDLEGLINYTFEICNFVSQGVSNTFYCDTDYYSDWENTLAHVRAGKQYKIENLEEFVKIMI